VQAAQNIKEALDLKYGPTWHVIVGEGFSLEITYEVWHLCKEITYKVWHLCKIL
jgi:hypothetical protein